MRKTTPQIEREIAQALAMKERRITDGQIRDLIAIVDRFHGTELKDRSETSVKQEIAAIRRWIEVA